MALQLFNDPLFGDIERTVSRAFQPYFGAMMPGKSFDAAFPSGGLYPMDIHEHKGEPCAHTTQAGAQRASAQ
ncbi:hypothetical protein [Bosea sp. (in: a-proteobacteria)]|uniref:hypothetical protein n=1 Tax=Bosea sp. (in: a-proteobacteria) TaxID=1871050 RepID=UPI0040339A7C